MYTRPSVCVCVDDGWIACFRLLGYPPGRLYSIYWIFRRQYLNCHCGAFFRWGSSSSKSGLRPVVSPCILAVSKPGAWLAHVLLHPITPEYNRNRLMSDRRNEKQKGPTILSYFDRVCVVRQLDPRKSIIDRRIITPPPCSIPVTSHIVVSHLCVEEYHVAGGGRQSGDIRISQKRDTTTRLWRCWCWC
jgi:hypothetical protein